MLRPLSALPGPRGLPLVGNLHQLDVARIHLVLEDWRERFGPVFTIRMGRRPALVLAETELVRQVLRDRPGKFRREESLLETARETGINGVFHAEGADWRKQRRLVMPAFGSGPTRAGWSGLRSMSDRLRARWDEAARTGHPVDVLQDLTRFTVDVTSHLVFGRDLNTLERGSDELQRNIQEIFATVGRRMFAPMRYWRVIRLPQDRRFDRCLLAVKSEMEALIQRAHEELAQRPAGALPRTLLEGMIQARDEEDPAVRFSDAEVLGNVLTLLLAGEDTTANTMAWMLYFVARDPEVQRRLQQEADRVLGTETSLPTPDDAAAMQYAGALAREALRLRSPAPMMLHQALEDVVLGDVAVPTGTRIFLLTRAADLDQLGRELQPDRWLGSTRDDARSDARRGVKEGLAFGDGPRICPGRSLALVECALVSAMVGRRFELSLAGEPRERFNFVVQPEGLRIRFRPRVGATEA
jgi:cytochrome P450